LPALAAGGLRVGPLGGACSGAEKVLGAHADLHYVLPLDKIICEEQSLGILSSQPIKTLFGKYLFILLAAMWTSD
jgi:hypothetical protein